MTESLNSIMEFDCVVESRGTGEIIPRHDLNPYFELNVNTAGEDEFSIPDGWELLRGFTGQYSYNGPVLHPSEFIGGGLETHIRKTPGYYVALVVEARCDYDGTTDCDVERGCDCEPAGWAVAYAPFTGDARLVQDTYHHGNSRTVTVLTLGELKARLALEAEHATDEKTRAGRRAYTAAALQALEDSGRGEWGWNTFVWADCEAPNGA